MDERHGDHGVGEKRRRHVRTERKIEAVLRVLKGDDPAQVAHDQGVSLDRLERWQGRFLDAGRAALVSKSTHRSWHSRLTGNSKALTQWVGLLILLILTVLFLVKFLNRDGGE